MVIFAFATVFVLYLQNLQLYLCLNQLTAFPHLILYAIEYVGTFSDCIAQCAVWALWFPPNRTREAVKNYLADFVR